MNRNRLGLIALFCAFGALWSPWNHIDAQDSAAQPKNKPAKREPSGQDVFGLTKIHEFHLELSAKEFEKMQPPGGGGFPGFGGPKKAPDKIADKANDVHRGGSFGIEFPWAHAEFVAEGKTYKEVGLRYKGGGSYVGSANKLKRNFKVELDRYNDDARFHGLKTLALNSGAADPTHFREALGYAVFRAAGVPAPRTAFAEVSLTVPGKYDKEFVGLYTVVEHVDKNFLKDHFKNGKGLLLKPERRPGSQGGLFDYQGEDWDRYKDSCGPKREPTKKEAQRVIEFAKLIHKAGDQEFNKQVGSYLDVDEFLRFLAGTSMICNLDSVFTIGHNVIVYLEPQSNKFVYIPWDLDLSFGGFPMFGSSDQQADLSLTHPYGGDYKLVDRLLANKEVSEKYKAICKELAAGPFAKEKLLKEIETMEKATSDAVAREKKAVQARKEEGGGLFGMFGGSPDIRAFVNKRTTAISSQLEGKGKGFIPTGFGGPKGGFGGQGKPGEILSAQQQDQLRLSTDQKKELAELQREIDARLDKLFTVDQRKQFKEMRDRGPGGFGPKGFGLGNFFAADLAKALDADKDGKITKDEVNSALKKFFALCDDKEKGVLDAEALEKGIASILPTPGFFFGKDKEKGMGGPMFGGFPRIFAEGTFKQAGVDKDGKVSLKQLSALADKLFVDADKAKKGYLIEEQLAEVINGLMPPPKFGPGFGGPGGGPPGGPTPGLELAPPPAPVLESVRKGAES